MDLFREAGLANSPPRYLGWAQTPAGSPTATIIVTADSWRCHRKRHRLLEPTVPSVYASEERDKRVQVDGLTEEMVELAMLFDALLWPTG
jgi:hypothetical protein